MPVKCLGKLDSEKLSLLSKLLRNTNQVTSQKNCATEAPTFFTDELLYITSLSELFLNPRAHDPTTRHTPSGFLPDLICRWSTVWVNFRQIVNNSSKEWKDTLRNLQIPRINCLFDSWIYTQVHSHQLFRKQNGLPVLQLERNSPLHQWWGEMTKSSPH